MRTNWRVDFFNTETYWPPLIASFLKIITLLKKIPKIFQLSDINVKEFENLSKSYKNNLGPEHV